MNEKISQLTTITNAQISGADLLPIVHSGTTDAITVQNLLNPLDSLFSVVNAADNTKSVAISASAVTTGTQVVLTTPSASDTIAGLAASQTLQNKTLGTNTGINITGSDSVGSLYYRNSSGILAPVSGTSGQIISFNGSNLPTAIPNPAISNASQTVFGGSNSNCDADKCWNGDRLDRCDSSYFS